MATATRTTKGFAVCCPFCNDSEATVTLDLNDLKACRCGSCDEEFSPAEALAKVAQQLRRWEAVQRWTEMAATFDAE